LGNFKTLLEKVTKLRTKEERHFAILSLIIISLPFTVILNSLLIIALVINSMNGFQWQKIKASARLKLPILFIGLPLIFSALSLIQTENLDKGYFAIEKGLSIIAFPIVFLQSKELSKKNITSLITVFIGTTVVIAMVCFGNSIWLMISNGGLIDQGKLLDREYYYFTYSYLSETVGMSPIYLGMYINFSIALVLNRITYSDKAKKYLLILVLLSVFLVLLLSKINVIIYFVVLFITAINWIKNKKSNVVVYLITATIAVLLMIVLIKPIKDRLINIDYFSYEIDQGHIGYWNGANLRMAIWECTIDPIKNNWLLGVGSGDVEQVLLDSYEDKDFKIGTLTGYNTHNQWLEFSLSFGIIATLIVLATNILVPLIIGFKKDYNLFIFLIIILLTSLTEVIFATQKGVVFYSLFLTLFLNNLHLAPKLK